MTRRVLLVCVTPAVLWCSCTRTSETKRASTTSELQTEKLDAEQQKVEVVQQGPSETRVYEFAPPTAAPSEPSPACDRPCHDPLGSRSPEAASSFQTVPAKRGFSGGAQRSPVGPEGASDNMPHHGALLKLTVTDTGPITDTTIQKAKEATTATQNTQTAKNTDQTTKTRAGPSVAFWMGIGALIVVLLVGGAIVAWEMQPPWVVFLRKLL